MNIGHRIRQVREAAGYRNGAAFSRKLGINPKTLWRYESDRSVPGLVNAVRIAEQCGITVEQLLYGFPETYTDLGN